MSMGESLMYEGIYVGMRSVKEDVEPKGEEEISDIRKSGVREMTGS